MSIDLIDRNDGNLTTTLSQRKQYGASVESLRRKNQQFEVVRAKLPYLHELTTGQVAIICNVASRTVSKWFDSGTLFGYRLPDSEDRRFPKENFLNFLIKHFPYIAREINLYRSYAVVYFGTDGKACETAIGKVFTVERHTTEIKFLMALGRLNPAVVVIDFGSFGSQAHSLCERLRHELTDKERPLIVGIGSRDHLGSCEYLDAQVSDLRFLLGDIQSKLDKKM